MAKKRATPRETSPLIGVIKETIRGSELSLTEIAKRTGLDSGQLSRFMRGERAITIVAAEKLVEYFDLLLVPRAKTAAS